MESVRIWSVKEGDNLTHVVAMDYITGESARVTDDQFMKIVTTGTRYWVNAPAEVKRFSDIVNHGRPLQDYATFPAYTNDRSREA